MEDPNTDDSAAEDQNGRNFLQNTIVLNANAANGDRNYRMKEHEGQLLQLRTRNRLLTIYLCNLCKSYVRGGVITICGHLFCWTCLWAELGSREIPYCPRCMHRLVLHEDIMPFLGEGPDAGPDDGNIMAQPGDVPRPSGLYLEQHQYPVWFAVHDHEELPFVGTDGVHRNFSMLLERMQTDFQLSVKSIKFLQWFQLCCVVIIIVLWMYTMTFTD